METKPENCKIDVGCGCSATITVDENCYVKVEFSNNNDGLSTIDLSTYPDLIMSVLSKIKKKWPDYEPKCTVGQGFNWIIYYFKIVL